MKTILIADDDSAIAALLSYTFESGGFKVSLVSDGLEALSLANEQSFDLILLDMMMPGLSGLAVTEQLYSIFLSLASTHLRLPFSSPNENNFSF